MIYFNDIIEKIVKRRIKKNVLGADDFIKSLSKSSSNVGYELYSELKKSINDFEIATSKVSDYLKEIFCDSFQLKSYSNYDRLTNKIATNKIVTNKIDRYKNVPVTSGVIIKKWMELQDEMLVPTFKETMGFDDRTIEQVENSLNKNELLFAEKILSDFYKDFLNGEITGLSLNEKTRKKFFLNYTDNLPFGTYSYTQLVNNIPWDDNIFKYSNNVNIKEDLSDTEEIVDMQEKAIDDRVSRYCITSLNEISYRNFYLYNKQNKNSSKNNKIDQKEFVIKHHIAHLDVFYSLSCYVNEIEAFKNIYQPMLDFLFIFGYPEVQSSIKENQGSLQYKNLINLIDSIYNYSLLFDNFSGNKPLIV